MDLNKEFVQLAKLAAKNRPDEIRRFLGKVIKIHKDADPQFSQELRGALVLFSEGSFVRANNALPLPVDGDSRLELLRKEDPITLEHEPIWKEHIKNDLFEVISERKRQDELLDKGLSPTKTLLFIGPPGVGKTIAARWIAKKLGRPLLTLDLAAVMSSFLGKTGNNIKTVLEYSKLVDCVLLLDEFDSVAKRRDDAVEIGELKRLVTVLLQEVDNWPDSGLLIAATNHPELLDPAVWRRFDKIIEFPKPDINERIEAIKLYLNNYSDDFKNWILPLSELYQDFSFSDIDKDIKSIRKKSIIDSKTIDEVLEENIRIKVNALEKSRKKVLAHSLLKVGLSQRRVSELTGISRDTIRKNNNSSNMEGSLD